MPLNTPRHGDAWERLFDLCKVLRGPEGCSWDRAQTPESLAPYLIEETHEVFDALACGDPEKVRDEIGDALYLWVLFLLTMEETGGVSLPDSVRRIEEKLIRRHPHVFGPAGEQPEGDSRRRWEQSKRLERSEGDDLLLPPPAGIPALARARRIQEKAGSFGFDWRDAEEVMPKVHEEIEELQTEIGLDADSARVREEMGDLLFAVVNLARHLGHDPEAALIAATEKFRKRFNAMARSVEEAGFKMGEAPLDLMESHWARIKSRPTDAGSP